MAAVAERSARVSTLELFFDLVFVFTITQLTGVLVDGHDAVAVAQVVVLLGVIWWMYDGYAWLTNAIATDRVRYRLLLIGGMGGFLVVALAIPRAWEGEGLAFGLAYLVVVLLHGGMYTTGTSMSEIAAILRIVPYNLAAAGLVLVGGALGGAAQWILWSTAAALVWISPRFTSTEGFVVSASHFVERHGLVVIVALGESIVVVGAGAADLPLDGGLVLVALLALALSAALWWMYFGHERDVEHAMREASPELRARLALYAFGYWHYGLLLGIVGVAAGLKKALGAPYEELEAVFALELAAGVALFAVCDAGFRKTMSITANRARLVAAALALATIPLGTQVSATAQVAVLVAIVSLAVWVESALSHR